MRNRNETKSYDIHADDNAKIAEVVTKPDTKERVIQIKNGQGTHEITVAAFIQQVINA